jgi:hypothetical protein
MASPIHKREYAAFLSHSSKDKALIVDKMYAWFTDIAHIPVWYDKSSLQGGADFASVLAKAIPLCRSIIIVLSQSSVKSGWVEQEFNLALTHQMQFKNFRIIPVVIDDCDIPGFLATRTHIRMSSEGPDAAFYDELVQALYFDDVELQLNRNIDLYVSRTWRASGAAFADAICKGFAAHNLRLIGDAEDQPNFNDSQARVQNIISSCGGLLAVLPYRADASDSGSTSKYCLEEIRYAANYKLPYVIFAEKGVSVPQDLSAGAKVFVQAADNVDPSAPTLLENAVETLLDAYDRNHFRHYVFFATDFSNPTRNQIVRKIIQRVTSMRCIMGEDIRSLGGKSVQAAIFEQVRQAFLVVGDISGDGVNTLVELGAARGAGVPHHIIWEGTPRRPPFMFRDEQVHFYTNDAELLGIIHRLVYPFRRRVLNNEMTL